MKTLTKIFFEAHGVAKNDLKLKGKEAKNFAKKVVIKRGSRSNLEIKKLFKEASEVGRINLGLNGSQLRLFVQQVILGT